MCFSKFCKSPISWPGIWAVVCWQPSDCLWRVHLDSLLTLILHLSAAEIMRKDQQLWSGARIRWTFANFSRTMYCIVNAMADIYSLTIKRQFLMLRTRETQQNNSFLCFMLSCFLRSAIKRGQTRAKHRFQLLIPSRKLVPCPQP